MSFRRSKNDHDPMFDELLDMLSLDDDAVKNAMTGFKKEKLAEKQAGLSQNLLGKMKALVELRDQALIRGLAGKDGNLKAFDQEVLDGLLEHALQLLEGAAKTSEGFSDTLGIAIEEIRVARDLVSLKNISRDLIDSSQNMMAATRQFKNNLGDMAFALIEQREKIKDLEGQLDDQKKAARTDPLTNSLNRGAFDQDFGKLVEVAKSFSRPLCMLLADLDRFKNINDIHGHQIGDNILINFADLLRRFMKRNPVYRYGGDEFVVLFPNTDLEAAQKMATEMDDWVAGHKYTSGEISLKLSFSAGLGQFRDSDDRGSFFKRVDDLLYQAKLNGRGQVCSE